MELSFGATFMGGLLTFISPCVFPLIPVYLSILVGSTQRDEKAKTTTTLIATFLFILGFTIIFSLLGMSASFIGKFLLYHKSFFQQLGGIIIILMGLVFIGYLRVPFFEKSSFSGINKWRTRFHFLNSFLFGILFALVWTPCIGAVLGAVLTYTALKTSEPLKGIFYLVSYSLGIGSPLLFISAFTSPALRFLKNLKNFIPVFEKITGIGLVLLGILFVTDKIWLIDSSFMKENQILEKESSEKKADENSDITILPSKPIVIEFYSSHCAICNQMIPIISAIKSECVGKEVNFKQVNVTTPSGKKLAAKFGVSGVPVFVFLSEKGKEISRLVGFQTISSLRKALSVLVREKCFGYRELPYLDRQELEKNEIK